MDLNLVLLFHALYFLRPQDWIPALSGAKLVTLVMAAVILVTLNRPGGIRPKELFRTPHDWLMLLYVMWAVYSSSDWVATLGDIKGLYVFYLVTLLALSSVARLGRYLRWWCGLTVTLAVVGIMTAWGIDVTDAATMIAANKGRLLLNTYMHGNPNALGHSVVIAIPMSLFLYAWRSPNTTLKGIFLAFLAGYCVYLTESKGAFIVGFTVLVLAFMFGRSRFFQVIIASLAILGGSAVLSALPRMQQLSNGEQGIQGRVLAWTSAYESLEKNPNGVGWKVFVASFMWEREMVEKATHSSYVQIGASLGHVGLFLYMAIIYSWFRTLLLANPATDEEDRLRRVLFVVAMASSLSNWMIDRAYHTEFFILTAAVAAYHRLVLLRRPEDAPGYVVPADLNPGQLEPQYSISSGAMVRTAGFQLPGATAVRSASGVADYVPKGFEKFRRWQRFGIVDIAVSYGLYRTVLGTWHYIVLNF